MNRNTSGRKGQEIKDSIEAFLFRYNMPVKELKKIESRIKERNSRTLKIVSSICAVMFLILAGLALIIDSLRDNLPMYLFALTGTLVIILYEWVFIKKFAKLQRAMLYMFLAFIHVFAIALGTYGEQNHLAVSYIVVLMAESVIFVDRPVRLLGFQTGSMILFTVAAFLFKEGENLLTDIVNVWTVGTLSFAVGAYMAVSIAKNILTEYKLENMGVIDQLTGLRNRNSYESALERYPYRAKISLSCVYMDVNGLHALNDKEGHESGDQMLQFMAYGFQKAFGERDSYRIGGDEFVALPVDMGIDEIRERISVLNRTYAKRNYNAAIGYAYTGVSRHREKAINVMELIKLAEENMYHEKEKYYRKVGFDGRSQRDAVLELKEQRSVLAFMEIDDLTGLYTKQAFYHHTQIQLRRNPDIEYNIIIMDIDNFKYVNERYGEETGDKILRKMADYIKNGNECCVLSGRYNSDIFVLLVEQREKSSEEMIADCGKKLMKDPDIQKVTLKFGVYENVEHTAAVSVLCDRAMIALRSIKGYYGVTIAKYDEKLREKIDWENKMEMSMEKALQEKQFQVYYQPKHDAKSEKLVGAEALVRWIHPEYGFISPGDFIPLFEKNGFVTELDHYVLEAVCYDLSVWMKTGIEAVPVSVNVSKLDFAEDDYWDRMHKPVDVYKTPKEMLHIEVTESQAFENMEELVDVLQKLRDEGFKIEMDDFGKGYSSLNTLGTLPLDIVKLDMSFIKEIKNERKLRVLASVLSMAKNLHLKTVAEGVETKEQLEVLRELGCDSIQGYYFSKPLPKDVFTEYLQKHSDED